MKKIVFGILLAGMISATGYAQTVKTDINYETSDITLSGSFDNAPVNGWAVVEVTPEGSEDIAYIGAFKADDSGNFSVTFRLSDDSETGNYDVSIGLYGEKKIYGNIFYATAEEVSTLLDTINDEEKSNDDIRKIVDDRINVLNITEGEYKKVDSKGKENIAKALADNRPYENLSEAKAVVYNTLAIEIFRCGKNADDIAAAFENYKDVYNINAENTKCFELFGKLGKEADYQKNKAVAYELMAEFDVSSNEEIYDAFDDAVFLAAIKCAKDPSSIERYLEDSAYEDVIDFDLSIYNKSKKETTAKYIYSQDDINSMDDLEDAIEASYKEQNKKKPSSSGGSGGSGGSSGGGIVNQAPVFVADKTESDNKEETTDKNNEENKEPVKSVFSDLENVGWAREAIEYLYEKDIISGVSENNFNPDGKITREQYILMLVKALGLLDEAAECEFSDIKPGHWAYNAVASAYDKKIVSGVSADNFGVGNAITRQDLSAVTYRAIMYKGDKDISSKELEFTDKDIIAGYAKESIENMVAWGYINGYPDGRFAPLGNATRAEAAQIIYSIIK